MHCCARAGVVYPAGLSAQNICDIYEGTVKSWTEIDASLPDVAPTPVARKDSSGSTSVFTEWLTKACSSFAPGQGKEVTWAAGVQLADGTGGVIDAVAATLGAIGCACHCFITAAQHVLSALARSAPTPLCQLALQLLAVQAVCDYLLVCTHDLPNLLRERCLTMSS